MALPDSNELRKFASKWTKAYRKRWADSPYGGPAEPNPTEVEEIIEVFVEAFEGKDGLL